MDTHIHTHTGFRRNILHRSVPCQACMLFLCRQIWKLYSTLCISHYICDCVCVCGLRPRPLLWQIEPLLLVQCQVSLWVNTADNRSSPSPPDSPALSKPAIVLHNMCVCVRVISVRIYPTVYRYTYTHRHAQYMWMTHIQTSVPYNEDEVDTRCDIEDTCFFKYNLTFVPNFLL